MWFANPREKHILSKTYEQSHDDSHVDYSNKSDVDDEDKASEPLSADLAKIMEKTFSSKTNSEKVKE